MKNLLKNLSVINKILLIILINVLFLVLLGSISYYGLTKTDGIKNQIVVNSTAGMAQMNADMMHDALRADVYNALLVDSGNVDVSKQVLVDLNEHATSFKESIDDLNKSDVSDKVKGQVTLIRKPLEEYIASASEIVNTAINGTVDYKSVAGKEKLENFKEAFHALEIEMEKLSELIEKDTLVSKDLSTSFASNVKTLLFLIVIGVVFIVLFIGLYIAKMISKPVVLTEEILAKLSSGEITENVEVDSKDETGRMLTSLNTVITNLSNVKEFVTEVGNGNFSTEVVVFNNQGDIYDSLNKMKGDLKHTAEEDAKRNWATQGMARFGDILRNNTDGFEALSNNIITNLVKYLGANQGGLFIVNDHNPKDKYLDLVACYAWDKTKHVSKRVNEGEGLVGQAWQEGDIIYITEVPQNFVKITSGLGLATPKSIIIVPLTVNDETYGVIELASFKLFEEYQIEFLKKLAESIASTISSSKVNERTKILLEQSQMQAEQMRAQEEEMRQNMEEMQATSEEAERKALNYESAIQRLNDEINELSTELKNSKG